MRITTCYIHWQCDLCGYSAGVIPRCNAPYIEHIGSFTYAINAVLGREINTIDPSILDGVCEGDATLRFLALHFHACLRCNLRANG
jgi:hypothetical protein